MTPLFRTLLAAVAVSAAVVPALAQEAATDQAEGAAEQPAADGNAASGNDLSMGSSTEPAVGQTYVREEFGAWSLRCVRTEDGADPCQLYQLLQDDEGNSVAEVSLFPITDGGPAAAGATIITPLETLLTEQVRIAVDAGAAKQYPFSFCSQIGCFSRVGFTAEEVEAFRRGSAATITIIPAAAPTQRVDLTMSLSGFTAGFEAVTAANAGQ
jgi:invasion protein IalB